MKNSFGLFFFQDNFCFSNKKLFEKSNNNRHASRIKTDIYAYGEV
jgi:hypothetical protein